MAEGNLGRIVVTPQDKLEQLRQQDVRNGVRAGVNPNVAFNSSSEELNQLTAEKADILKKLLESGVASVEKAQSKQIEQAMTEGGMDALSILGTLVEQYQKGKQAQGVAGQQPEQPMTTQTNLQPVSSDLQEQAKQILANSTKPVKSGFMGGIIDIMSGGAYNRAMQSEQIDNASTQLAQIGAVQKIVGEEPVQPTTRYNAASEYKKTLDAKETTLASDRYKAGEAALKPILEAPKLSVTDNNVINNMKQGLDATKELEALIAKNPGVLKRLSLPGDKLGQKVKALTQRIFANFAFTEAGKTLSKTEEKIQRGRLPDTEWAAYFQDAGIAGEKIGWLRKGFEEKLGSIDPNDKNRQLFQEYLKAGYSREEAIARFQQLGII